MRRQASGTPGTATIFAHDSNDDDGDDGGDEDEEEEGRTIRSYSYYRSAYSFFDVEKTTAM